MSGELNSEALRKIRMMIREELRNAWCNAQPVILAKPHDILDCPTKHSGSRANRISSKRNKEGLK